MVAERLGEVPTWEPLRHPVFRSLWIANLGANVGTWAMTVGAQWLMGDLGGGALAVALVQTATTLPVFLLVVPAGAIGDIVDRRRLLLIGTLVMLVSAAALAGLASAGLVTPALLLALTAATGVGAAISLPSFAAIQPELVPRAAIPHAALLNGANLNVARAVGPAIGGALIGVAGPEATFALSAVSLLGVAGVLARWDRAPDHRPLGAEHVRAAIVTGIRYIRSAPAFGTVLARAALFIVFASALWALLPVVARGPLGLGAGGYGLLLGAVGAGAVAGAFAVPLARRRVATNEVVAAGAIAYSAAVPVIGLSRSLPVVVAALVVAGVGWIAVMSNLSACAQLVLPNWARARAFAFFTLVFMGGQAVGGVLWGAVAQALGVGATFALAGAGGLLGPIAGARGLALRSAGDVRAARHWPQPVVQLDVGDDAGPVLVTIEWQVERDVDGFLDVMRRLGQARRRTGAVLWGLFQDAAEPLVFVETFTVDTWREHLRQHLERGTVADEQLEALARHYAAGGAPREVRHLLWAFRDLP